MKRIITVNNVYGTGDKYVLRDEYEGFGIYQEKVPTGYFVNQSWLISNNEGAELVINSYNNICKEEVLDIIDHYNETYRFGVKALKHCGALHMHPGGTLI